MLWLGYSSVNIDWSDRIFLWTIHSMLDTIYTMTYRAPVGANKSELGVVSYYWWWLSVPMVGRKSREGSLLAGDARTGSQVGESAFPPLGHHATGHTHTSLPQCFVCRYSSHGFGFYAQLTDDLVGRWWKVLSPMMMLCLLDHRDAVTHLPGQGHQCWCGVWLGQAAEGWVRISQISHPLATGCDIHGIEEPD